MSEAYESALNISFDIRGGLLVRQVHHWAALVFVGAIAVHALRIFFTGAFRKPRELNWVIGVISFRLGIAVEDLVWVLRTGFFVLPVTALFVTGRVCIALQRADRRRLRAGLPYGIAAHSPDGAAAQPGPAALAPAQPDGQAAVPQPELSYAPVSRPLSEQERERLTAHRPDQLIRPIPKHLIPLPAPRRALAQVRARLNRQYLLTSLEPPYKDRSDGHGSEQPLESDGRPSTRRRFLLRVLKVLTRNEVG